MALFEQWQKYAEEKQSGPDGVKFWETYFSTETDIYKKILEEKPDKNSLKEKNPLEEIEEDSEVNLDYEEELLYKNMVDAKADWLYHLPQWDALIPEERRKELYKEQKLSKTVVKGQKIGRNDPCPCGSGKKYKKCCGRDM